MKVRELLTRFWFAFLRIFGLDSCPVEPLAPVPPKPSPDGRHPEKAEPSDFDESSA